MGHNWSMPPVDASPPGLRERKKARTRQTLREEAFRLIREQGYAQTTVEQIAAAADVSPSTFFRYFPSKEALVIADDIDPVIIELFRAQPEDATVLDALRAAVTGVASSMTKEQWRFEQERSALLTTEPQLHGAMRQETQRSVDLIAGLVAERCHLDAADLRVRALAGALVGGYQALREPPNVVVQDFDLIGFLGAGMPLDGAAVLPKSRQKRGPRSRRTD
jgi:AcrR family transcriptional regulator